MDHGPLDFLLTTDLPVISVKYANFSFLDICSFLEAVPGAVQGPPFQQGEVSAQQRVMRRAGLDFPPT